MHTFFDYFHDLEEANFETHGTKLRLLVNYCESEDPLRPIISALHQRAGRSYEKWIHSILEETKEFSLPETPSQRAAYAYILLYNLKRRYVELRVLLSRCFTGKDLNDRFGKFLELVVGSLVAFLRRVSRGIVARMQEADPEQSASHDIEDLLAQVVEEVDRAVTSEAQPVAEAAAPPTASKTSVAAKPAAPRPPESPATPTPRREAPSSPPAAPTISRSPRKTSSLRIEGTAFEDCLRDLIYVVSFAGDFDPDAQSDYLTDMKMLRLELSKHVPNRERVVDLLETMRQDPALAGKAERAIERLSELA